MNNWEERIKPKIETCFGGWEVTQVGYSPIYTEYDRDQIITNLINLFNKLLSEACKEQRETSMKIYIDAVEKRYGYHYTDVANAIQFTPSPEGVK